MERPETYTAIIEVTFDVWDDEKPRTVARDIISSLSGSRGGNCYMDATLKKLIEEKRAND